MTLDGTYRQRHPEQTGFYQCREDYGQEFKESYPDFYEKDHGPLRIRCPDCHHAGLLAFSRTVAICA